MKATGIQQQTTTIQATEVEADLEVLEQPLTIQTSHSDTAEQMRSSQQNANERKADAYMDGQLRRMQLEGAVSTPAAEAGYSPVREKLTYGFGNLMIDNSDVADVHTQLQKLTPSEYRATLVRMDKDGLLNRYINNMDDDSLKAFLRQALDSGYIKLDPAYARVQGRFEPPTPPALLKNDRNLPTAVREAIHQENLNSACRYYKSYGEYIKRYSDAVLQARSGEEIRAIGAPVNRKNLAEPGVTNNNGDKDYSRFVKDWYSTLSGYPMEARGYMAISDRMHDLTGAKRAGSVWFTSEFQIGAEKKLDQHANLGAVAKGRFEFSPYGATYRQIETSGQFSTNMEGNQFSDGVQKSVLTAPNGVRHESDFERTTSVGVESKETGFSVQNDGTFEGSLAVGGAPHGYARFNPNDGFMELGIGKSQELGIAKGQIRLGLGLQGSNPERVRDAIIGDVGTFGTPSELERGMSWQSLSADRRGYFERSLGWNEAEWNKRLAEQKK